MEKMLGAVILAIMKVAPQDMKLLAVVIAANSFWINLARVNGADLRIWPRFASREWREMVEVMTTEAVHAAASWQAGLTAPLSDTQLCACAQLRDMVG